MNGGKTQSLTPEQEALKALNLPYKGEFPFVPPKRWQPTQRLHTINWRLLRPQGAAVDKRPQHHQGAAF
jgi:hypothetical protein